MRRTIPLVVVVLLLVSCGGGEGEQAETPTPQTSASAPAATGSPTASPTTGIRTDYDVPPYGDLAKMYDYEASAPLGYKVISEEREKGATVYSVEYRSSGHAVPSYLVVPDGQGPFPVVLYAHGIGAGPEYFLPDAVALAHDGIASLLITSPLNRPPFASLLNWEQPQRDVEAFVQYVIDLRRGLDLLETLPEIDAGRMGYMGHSLGTLVGGILAGVDDRIDAYVLSAHGAYYTDFTTSGGVIGSLPTGEALARFQDGVAVVNPVNYIGHNGDAAFLFQASETDQYVSVENFQAYFDAGPEPKTLEWYEGGHELGCTDFSGCEPSLPAFVDHRAWLQENV